MTDDPNDPAGKDPPNRDPGPGEPNAAGPVPPQHAQSSHPSLPGPVPPQQGGPIVPHPPHPPQGYPPQTYAQPPQGYPPQVHVQPPYAPQGSPPQGYGPPMMYVPQNIHIAVQNTHPGAGLVYPQGIVRVASRNRVAAAVLAFLFGGLGVHKFYLGRPLAGVFYLLFFWTFIPYLLGLIDFVLLLLMSDHEFELKYNTALQLPRAT